MEVEEESVLVLTIEILQIRILESLLYIVAKFILWFDMCYLSFPSYILDIGRLIYLPSLYA